MITPLKSYGFAALLVGALSCAVVDDQLFAPLPSGYQGDGGGNATSTSSAGGGTTQSGDLPCDVAVVLANHCDSCHATTTPPFLRSRADFMEPSAADPNMSLAEASVARMQDAASPMPPAGLPPAADTQIIADWIAAGLPAGDCGAGTGGSGGSPYDAEPTCTSGRTWNRGTDGGESMYPGRACNACHQTEKPGEIYAFAGTVYPTAHEPDDCLGVGADAATVEFTDDNGQVTTATTNDTGNFSLKGGFAFPVTVRVLAGGKELPMVAPLQSGDGDCNTCHNQDGTDGAPGRIILPF